MLFRSVELTSGGPTPSPVRVYGRPKTSRGDVRLVSARGAAAHAIDTLEREPTGEWFRQVARGKKRMSGGDPAVASADQDPGEGEAQEGIGRSSFAACGTDPLSVKPWRRSSGPRVREKRQEGGPAATSRRRWQRGKAPGGRNPKGVTGMKQGRKVRSRRKPSRG